MWGSPLIHLSKHQYTCVSLRNGGSRGCWVRTNLPCTSHHWIKPPSTMLSWQFITTALRSRYGHSTCITPCVYYFLSSSFFFLLLLPLLLLLLFLAYSQRSQIGCLPYFYTWCGFSANLECTSEMHVNCTRRNAARWKYGMQKLRKNRPLSTIAQIVGLYLRNYGTYRQSEKKLLTRIWANAQRDGRPAEHRWRPLFNAAKFGWRPLLDCRAVTLPRRNIRWNMMGCPKPANRCQPLVDLSSPYCKNIWRRYCCLTSFFRLSIRALVAKI